MTLSLLGQRWQRPPPLPGHVQFEQVHPSLWSALLARGIETPQALQGFLTPGRGTVRHEGELADMDRAVALVLDTMKRGGRICIFGDYDADGLSGAAVLWGLLRPFYEAVGVYLPLRAEGYGLGVAGLKKLKQHGVELVITVDNGTTAHDAVRYAREAGIKVIVTDHHQPEEELPPADALLNPHRRDCAYPFKGLSGCAVAFKLGVALAEALGGCREEALQSQVDLVGLSLLSDKMPLVDENRYFSQQALLSLREGRRTGLRALLQHIGRDTGALTAYDLDFHVIPRLNASGRLGSPMTSFELLVSDDAAKARRLAEQLEAVNTKRRKIQEDVLREVKHRLRARQPWAVVESGPWHFGVLGVVASRVAEDAVRPTLLLCPSGEADGQVKLKGSGRNPTDMDFLGALRQAHAAGLLTKVGGHHAAMGVEMRQGALPELTSFLEEQARTALLASKPVKSLLLDGALHLRDAGEALLEQLMALEPFGRDNPMPVFHVPDLTIKKAVYKGGLQEHLKVDAVDARGDARSLMFFGGGRLSGPAELTGRKVDAALCLGVGGYPGEGPVALKVQDLLLHG